MGLVKSRMMADSEKNREGPEPSSPASRGIRRVAFLGFLLNLALAGMKGLLASATGSLAITASAVDSATDSISSFAAWAGLRLSERRTATFPMGLYKIENVISVVVALFIFVAGYELARQAVTADLEAPEVQDPMPETEVLGGEFLFRSPEHRNGGGGRRVEKTNPGRLHFHLSGGHFRILSLRRPQSDLTFHLDHVFSAQLPGQSQGFRISPIGPNGNLKHPAPVPEVDEIQASQVSPAVYPS